MVQKLKKKYKKAKTNILKIYLGLFGECSMKWEFVQWEGANSMCKWVMCGVRYLIEIIILWQLKYNTIVYIIK